MPEIKKVSEFEYKEGYDHERYVSERIDETRVLVAKTLKEISTFENKFFQAICAFSLIDSFAQEVANYSPYRAEKSFSDFVIKYQKKYDFLEKIEPVTLFYDVEDYIDEVIKYPELYELEPEQFPPEKEISLDEILQSDETCIKSVIDSDFSMRLLEIVERKLGEKAKKDCIKCHSFIHLLYKMRSKLVHELSRIGIENKWEAAKQHREPFYRDLSRLYKKDLYIVSDNVYELIIPNEFIIDLAENCINNYLEECSKEKQAPFVNDVFYKKVKLSWHDKEFTIQ